MAQAAAMGPPLSPRETRRSGRRSAPSASTSASKSPDSDPAPRQKDIPPRPSLTSNNSGRNKRPKQEDFEDVVDDRKNVPAPSSSWANPTCTATLTNSRTKRKAKEKDKHLVNEILVGEAASCPTEDLLVDAPEEEEQGITRCVCGSTGEDDPDAGEFMVQCETCKVWQHGLCMGYESEDQLHDDDYYCEKCRPELHTELLKKLSKRPRHSSTTSHHNPAPVSSRLSRSHSPSHNPKQPSKRRNTMNSRDAAFDESLKEIMEATAAEAAAAHETVSAVSAGNINGPHENEEDTEPGPNRKKRKRVEDDTTTKKRTRSASSASDHQGSTIAHDDTPLDNGRTKPPPPVATPAPKASNRNAKRGGRKVAAPDTLPIMEGEDGPTTKRQGNNGRARASNAPKRPPVSHSASHVSVSVSQDHGSRRNQVNGSTCQNTGSNATESSRAYRNSHAYVVSQQPLFTSWNLPDYLAHLEEMLPTDTPKPLEVRASGTGTGAGGRGESLDRTMERGVKVKWPSKRMSVGDMNKRVRALVEWVGREQASALDRARRRDALEKALKEDLRMTDRSIGEVEGRRSVAELRDISTAVKGDIEAAQEKGSNQTQADYDKGKTSLTGHTHEVDDSKSSATMKMMEELMEELIGFQERFGPGVKVRERERRLVS